ncbi:MAG: YHS domain-containing (seleno)protein [Pseudolabrys sp.]
MQTILRGATRRFWRVLAATLMLACTAPLAAQVASPEVHTGLVKGVAVGGYDPVAYFTEHKPVQGRGDILYSWKGVTWRFASEASRTAFGANPEKYAPQYGGYRAYAVSQGGVAKGDPKVWAIVGGKLYLNLSPTVQKLWTKDEAGYIKAADKNWPGVLK